MPDDKKDLFEKLIDLLKEFDRVCRENDIKYFVFAGTMLGAIRHKGIIPWDDDVDVILLREDYNKLKGIANTKKGFRAPYFFQSPSSDIGYPKGFCRLRNSDTTEIPFGDVAMKCNRGIFIDVFPLDTLPDNENKRIKQDKQLYAVRRLMNLYARYYSGFGTEGLSRVKAISYYMILPAFKIGLLSMDKLYKRFDRIASKYTTGKYVSPIAFFVRGPRFVFEKKWWESKVIWVDFMDMKVPVPKEYDVILKQSYGHYMTPVKEPTNHGELLYSATIPYEEFLKDHFEELKSGWLKQLQ